MSKFTVIRRSRPEASARATVAKTAKDREIAMEAVAAPIRNAGPLLDRIAMARRLIRYAATCACHMEGVAAVGQYLVALGGHMLAEAAANDNAEKPR